MGGGFITEDDSLLRSTNSSSEKYSHMNINQTEAPHNRWVGSWYSCFGDCGRESWSACCLTAFLPCLSSGLTVRRALKENIYIHLFIYIAIFFGVHLTGCWLQTAVMGNHEVACNAVFQGADPLTWGSMGMPVECEPLVSWYLGRYLADGIAAIAGAAYLARRRTLIRQRFGIAGSRFRDFCLFFWCHCCALCQEYRTLAHNNVVDGEWHGPVTSFSDGNLSKPPPEQFMV